MVGLGDLPGGGSASYGYAVSPDGAVVVGESSGAMGYEAFRWTAETGMVGLGDLPGGPFESRALGVSADGSIIVGESRIAAGGGGSRAFIWTETLGMVDLRDYLIDNGAEGLEDWQLWSAVAITPDGTTIVGNGNLGGWRATIATIVVPEPSSWAMLLTAALSGIVATVYRRRGRAGGRRCCDAPKTASITAMSPHVSGDHA